MNKNFEYIRAKGEALYKTIIEIYCPYFKENIYFNAQGLEHLKFKKRDKNRSKEDQYMRFKLLHLAPEIIKTSHTVQGIWKTKQFESIRKNSRTEDILREVTYYEFIAVVKNTRVKIILKEVESERKLFWSIIPFWKIHKSTKSRIFHEGYPSED